ncbi:tyrosine-protein phosphatase [Pseudoramibacter faecis]|uniref:tyrosine-protein phosphatase n=1 Tax=Pseudoramibacter faecis TaxID=3108534 RepID=UPI002E77B748|nr:tyrosine-protein phosphatase [Pseudoramibacter sp. HA2172]
MMTTTQKKQMAKRLSYGHYISLNGTYNIRDLGGIPTADGRKIATERLLRGDHLNWINAEDVQRLGGIVHRVVDLRRPSETAHQPDVIIPRVFYHRVPILPDEGLKPAGQKQRASGMLLVEQVQAMDLDVVGFQAERYRRAALNDGVMAQIRQVLAIILENETGAVLWHCTAGKDRTGMIAAIVLLALGVEMSVVLADYLVSNVVLAEWIKDIVDFSRQATNDPQVLAQIALLCQVQQVYFETAVAAVSEAYGSVDAYLTKALGLDKAARTRLQEHYLVD